MKTYTVYITPLLTLSMKIPANSHAEALEIANEETLKLEEGEESLYEISVPTINQAKTTLKPEFDSMDLYFIKYGNKGECKYFEDRE